MNAYIQWGVIELYLPTVLLGFYDYLPLITLYRVWSVGRTNYLCVPVQVD